MLLPNHNGSITSAFSTANADANFVATTGERTQNGPKPSAKDQQPPQQPKR